MKRTERSVKRSCDKLASKLCRSLGYCEKCGMRDGSRLQQCHIKSRRYLSIRWDKDNNLCLCAKCHRWFHDHPDLFTEWINEKWPDRLDRLNKKFQGIFKMTMEDRLDVEAKLKKELNEVEQKGLDNY